MKLRFAFLLILALIVAPTLSKGQDRLVRISPTTTNFGPVVIDSCVWEDVTIENISQRPLEIAALRLAPGDAAGFTLESPPLPIPLQIGASISVRVTFCPHDSLERIARLIVIAQVDTASVDTSAVFTGKGIRAKEELSHTRLAFEFDETAGGTQSATLVDSLLNSGDTDIIISGIEIIARENPFSVRIAHDVSGVVSREIELGPDTIGFFPLVLHPEERFRILVRFEPPVAMSPPCAIDTLTLITSAGDQSYKLAGCILQNRLVWSSPTVVDFGSVLIGSKRDTLISLVNITSEPIVLGSVMLDQLSVQYGFTLVAFEPEVGETVEKLETLAVRIRFAPIDTSSVESELNVRPGGSAPYTIRIAGSGHEVVREEIAVSIEPAAGTVSQPLGIRVRLVPGVRSSPSRRKVRVRLQFNPRSFFPLGGNGWVIADRVKGDVTFEQTSADALEGDVLAPLTLQPLSTAQPIDTVRLVEVAIEGERTKVVDAIAIITLDGCDIGRDVRLERAIRVDAAASYTTTGIATIDYRAASGVMPVARIIDLAGETIRHIQLPPGTDDSQRLDIDLRSIPPGTFFVELRAGATIVTIPIMHGY